MRLCGLRPRLKALFRRVCSGSLRQENADAIIEMAVVLPAFTLLLFGLFQFSITLASYLSAEYAINVATRYAAIHSNTSLAPCTTATIQSMVQSNLFFANAVPPSINVTYYQFVPTSGNAIGNLVYVTITYNQNISVPFYNHTFSLGSNAYQIITR